jgi:surfeit locus 1 family protein
MSVEVGWSKDPNAKLNWRGGPVSGIIVPDRRSRMRLIAATAPPGLQLSKAPEASSISPVTPAGHRGYAATWFSLAAIALIIYGLAVRKRLREGRTKT